MARRLNFRQLERLWIEAGGPADEAATMAAIAMAESGGRANAVNHNSNGSTDLGLWQINSIHGYGNSSLNIMDNARQAVAIFRSSGLQAWSSYKNGSYRQFVSNASPASSPRWVSPVARNATFERVDQGVDYSQSEPYVAVADGRVTAISRGWHGGTGIGVYITLDHPITVNGRTYDQVYYAELHPLVKVGERVKAGQAVASGGAGELGFAHDNGPVAPLAGGFGSGTQASVAGHDFLDLAQNNPNVQISAGTAPPIETATASHHADRAQGFGIGYAELPPAVGGMFSGPQQSGAQEGAYGMNMDPLDQPLSPIQTNDIWQQLAQGNASPETRQFAANSSQIHATTPAALMPPGLGL